MLAGAFQKVPLQNMENTITIVLLAAHSKRAILISSP
jgi:hypothetical protein